jgi:hypothetical protein
MFRGLAERSLEKSAKSAQVQDSAMSTTNQETKMRHEQAWAGIQNHDSRVQAARGDVSALVPACHCGKALPEPVEPFRCTCGWSWKVEEVVSDR